MIEIHRYSRKATDPDRIIQPIDLPEGSALLLAELPDYVYPPQELRDKFNLPERISVLGGEYLNWQGKIVLHYKLDAQVNSKQLWVAKADKFYWHTRS